MTVIRVLPVLLVPQDTQGLLVIRDSQDQKDQQELKVILVTQVIVDVLVQGVYPVQPRDLLDQQEHSQVC